MDKPHKKLDAWTKGMSVVREIYRMTASFPGTERYGLTSQMRRAAASIPANIAEGAARQTKKEFVQFLYIAKGSLNELDTFVELAVQLSFVDEDRTGVVRELMARVDQLLSGLIRRNVSIPSPSISRFPSPVSRS